MQLSLKQNKTDWKFIKLFRPKFDNQFFVYLCFLYNLQMWNCFCFDLQHWQNNFRFTKCTRNVNQQRNGLIKESMDLQGNKCLPKAIAAWRSLLFCQNLVGNCPLCPITIYVPNLLWILLTVRVKIISGIWFVHLPCRPIWPKAR